MVDNKAFSSYGEARRIALQLAEAKNMELEEVFEHIKNMNPKELMEFMGQGAAKRLYDG